MMINNSFKIALVLLILSGLCAAIAHPFAHVLNNRSNNSFDGLNEDPDQTVNEVSSEIDCYVCTFSKSLTFDEFSVAINHKLPSDDFITLKLFFADDYRSSPAIYLRAPPTV